MNPKVDEYLGKAKKWQEELFKLQEIILDCQLVEELKWKVPCYTINGKNIVLIHAFKDYCALLFMKGSLLNDSKNILFQQTDNVQSGRQIRFTNIQEIINLEVDLKAYIFEAIEVEKAGLKIEYKKTEDFEMYSLQLIISYLFTIKTKSLTYHLINFSIQKNSSKKLENLNIELIFCGYHAKKHEEQLKLIASEYVDETDRLGATN